MDRKNVFDAYTIKNQKKLITVPEDIVILREGEVNLDMYKLVSGHVEMYTGYETENEVLIGILGPGACFGEFGILLRKPAIYTIVTYSKVKLLRVTEDFLDEFVQENHDSIIQIMKNMADMMMILSKNVGQLSGELENMQKKLTAAPEAGPEEKKTESSAEETPAGETLTEKAAAEKAPEKETVQNIPKTVLRKYAFGRGSL